MNDNDRADRVFSAWEEKWRNAFAPGPETQAQMQRVLDREELLRWEHELSQPNYYDYFLEEVTR